jgi:hypothetical protein
VNVSRRQVDVAVRLDDPAWSRVRRLPGLSGEDKLAWLGLWDASRGGRDLVSVTAAEVGAYQGVTDKPGRTRLRNLQAIGLVETSGPDRLGQWACWVLGPDELGQPKRFDGEPQLEFDEFLEQEVSEPSLLSESRAVDEPRGDVLAMTRPGLPRPAQTAAPPQAEGTEARPYTAVPPERREVLPEVLPEVPSLGREVPPVATHSPLNVQIRDLSRTFKPSKPSRWIQREGCNGAGETGGGTSGGSAPAVTPASLGEAVAGLTARLPTVEDQQLRVDALVERILRAIADPLMRRAPAAKAAWNVIEGRVPMRELDALLRSLENARRAGKLRTNGSTYFNQAIKRLHARYAGSKP